MQRKRASEEPVKTVKRRRVISEGTEKKSEEKAQPTGKTEQKSAERAPPKSPFPRVASQITTLITGFFDERTWGRFTRVSRGARRLTISYTWKQLYSFALSKELQEKKNYLVQRIEKTVADITIEETVKYISFPRAKKIRTLEQFSPHPLSKTFELRDLMKKPLLLYLHEKKSHLATDTRITKLPAPIRTLLKSHLLRGVFEEMEPLFKEFITKLGEAFYKYLTRLKHDTKDVETTMSFYFSAGIDAEFIYATKQVSVLELAVRSINVAAVKFCVQHVNIASDKSSLGFAVRLKSTEIVKILLEHKANPDVETKSDKSTPLIEAAIFHCDDIIKLLVAAKADVNHQDMHDSTALSISANKGHEASVDTMLTFPSLKTETLTRALRDATNGNYHSIMRKLKIAGADCKVAIKDGKNYIKRVDAMKKPLIDQLKELQDEIDNYKKGIAILQEGEDEKPVMRNRKR